MLFNSSNKSVENELEMFESGIGFVLLSAEVQDID